MKKILLFLFLINTVLYAQNNRIVNNLLKDYKYKLSETKTIDSNLISVYTVLDSNIKEKFILFELKTELVYNEYLSSSDSINIFINEFTKSFRSKNLGYNRIKNTFIIKSEVVFDDKIQDYTIRGFSYITKFKEKIICYLLMFPDLGNFHEKEEYFDNFIINGSR